MKETNTATRLKEIMSDRNLRQVDILNLAKPYCEQYGVKLNKSDLSQYCSGKVEPNQDKLFILSSALNVDVSWLMGYENATEAVASSLSPANQEAFNSALRHLDTISFEMKISKKDIYTKTFLRILKYLTMLNDAGKKEAAKRVKELTFNPNFRISDEEILAAAHDRTDIEVTEEMKKHDDDIMNDDSEWE